MTNRQGNSHLNFRHHLRQFLIVPLAIALVATHLSSLEFFPTNPAYRFPLAHFTANLIAISVIVMGMEFIFSKTGIKSGQEKKVAIRRFLLNSIAFVTVFISLFYFAIYEILGYQYNLYTFTVSVLGTVALSALYSLLNYGWRFTALEALPNKESHITVKSGVTTHVIALSDIGCFTLNHKTVFLISKEGKTIITNFTLRQLETLLDHDVFFRASRQSIISREAISKIKPLANNSVEVFLKNDLTEESRVTVSRHRAAAFRKWFLS